MTWVATAIAGSAVLGAIIGNKQASAQKEGAQAALQGQQDSLALQEKMFNKQIELQEPFRRAGINAQNKLMVMLGLSGDRRLNANYGVLNHDFGMSDFTSDPGYAFRVSEGLKALDRQAAAKGGLISGAALKAAERYGQDNASQEYQNAFNRYQINRANKIQPLQSLMGAGQTATNVMGGAAQNYSGNIANAYSNMGNIQQGIGQANADRYGNMANSITNGVSSYLNYKSQNELLNSLKTPRYSGSDYTNTPMYLRSNYGY